MLANLSEDSLLQQRGQTTTTILAPCSNAWPFSRSKNEGRYPDVILCTVYLYTILGASEDLHVRML